MLRLRKAVGEPTFINARDDDPIVSQLWLNGYDLNEGMAAKYGGRVYHGADCIHLLALLSTTSGLFNKINGMIFGSRKLSCILYPVLRMGRSITLRLLRIRKISYPGG